MCGTLACWSASWGSPGGHGGKAGAGTRAAAGSLGSVPGCICSQSAGRCLAHALHAAVTHWRHLYTHWRYRVALWHIQHSLPASNLLAGPGMVGLVHASHGGLALPPACWSPASLITCSTICKAALTSVPVASAGADGAGSAEGLATLADCGGAFCEGVHAAAPSSRPRPRPRSCLNELAAKRAADDGVESNCVSHMN